jgi:glycosyltransferase involved in cell wall biosynthesis
MNHIIAISRAVKDSLKGSLVKTPISVIYNGVRTDTFHPSSQKRATFRLKYGIKEREIAVGISSRIAEEKGHRTFIEAAKIVAREDLKVKFIIAGDAVFDVNMDFKDEMIELVRKSGIDSIVLWTGFIEKTDELFPALDILVVASHAEPFGRVVIEAGACGIPVVGTAEGGIPEIIKDGETGILVPPKNPLLMAEAIIELARDKERRLALGQKARKRITRDFTLSRQVEAVERLYEHMLGLERLLPKRKSL